MCRSIRAIVLTLISAGVLTAQVGEPLPTEDFTPATITVPDGFIVELVAGPPLVRHPTFATFDDRGRLFVSENAGVNMTAAELEQHLPNSIRLLEDTTGDGKFDRSTVFADKMTFPMGGAWHEGSLYVASPPAIWKLTDTTGDGVADRREILVDKFGYTGNAADIHGCFNGPDGRLYWCDGRHGHEIHDADGNLVSKRAGSYLFSCWPDGSDVRIHCGGGMDNPVEIDFTDEGEMLGTVNIMYSRPRVDGLVHWLHGGAYPHSERVLDELKRTGPLLGPFHRLGHVAVSGVTRYRSGAMNPAWRDHLFVALFNGGKVVRVEIQRDGASFRATQREFLSGPGRDFHVTDVTEDADGSLLVVDTGGWFYRGCPTSQLAKPEIKGAIYRVRRADMPIVADPRGLQIDWVTLTDHERIALLDDDRFTVRERAIRECVRRGESIVPVLAQTLTHAEIRGRRNAVWALCQIDTDSARRAMVSALDDTKASVRLTACRAFAHCPEPSAIPKLIDRLTTDTPPIRREAATTLGRWNIPDAVPALLAAMSRKPDRTEEHALIYALIEINDPRLTARGLNVTSPDVRRAALIALGQMDAGRLTVDQVTPLLADDDAELRSAALSEFRRHPDWGEAASRQLDRWFEEGMSTPEQVVTVLGLMSAFLTHDRIARQIGATLADPDAPVELKHLVLRAVASGRSVTPHPSWLTPLKQELSGDDPERLSRVLTAISALRTDHFDSALDTLASDSTHSPTVRVAAVQALARGRAKLSDGSFAVLLELLRDRASPTGASRAAQLLGSVSLTREQFLALTPLLRDASPTDLRDLIRPFGRTNDPNVIQAFLDVIKQAPAFPSLPMTEFSDVVNRYPAEVRAEANRLLDRLRQEHERKLGRLDALLGRLDNGNPKRGREVFFSEQAKCASCHRVGDRGEHIGPDLTTIGANRTSADLLESIVFPSASLVRDYESYTVSTLDGRTFTGLIAKESASGVELQLANGEIVTLTRDDIDEMVPNPVSLMPNGLDEALREEQLADVVAYLMTLK